MPFALDMPATPTGQASGAEYQHGFRTEQVARREQPYYGGNITYHYRPNDIPEYAWQRMVEAAQLKVHRLMPLFSQRLEQADSDGRLIPFAEDFARAFTQVMTAFALNPKFKELSFSVTHDGGFELARVNPDKTEVDYLTIYRGEENEDIMATFSKLLNRKSVFNTFGTTNEVFKQLVVKDIF